MRRRFDNERLRELREDGRHIDEKIAALIARRHEVDAEIAREKSRLSEEAERAEAERARARVDLGLKVAAMRDEGMTNAEIAAKWGLSIREVKPALQAWRADGDLPPHVRALRPSAQPSPTRPVLH